MTAAIGNYLFNTFCDHVIEHLPAYLQEVQQEGGVTLPMFRTVQRGWRDVFSLNAYDGILFVPFGIQRQDHTVTLQVRLWMVHESKKPETMTDRQLVYADALSNLVKDDPRLSAKAEHTEITDVRYLTGSAGTKELCLTAVELSVQGYYRRDCKGNGG